ncbi:toll/interleukin-1 receptor domain-containing protein [Granulicella tundricola]|uniref:TIR domain-containing protein n=1 Tax=Granulicella tundricola (strain ATCC BAA-1859 / DSM 23138 / MP5ACTX9) TaxID=1198114 RepID=E8X0P4_GRATM|nr:toll/interleukin-1 receptor domain-containing protein [Granulicella tundricola]ADW68995.1 hypothetical protein AciX9_1949 [Granulicella tundricola MP5ACTX9]
MRVFLSWSGPKSRAVAELLKKYLPSLNNTVDPWLSSKEISTGARWSSEIAANLEAANIGVICVTAENQNEPWILFEAGAVSKLTTVGRAMVLRIGMKATDITGPLSQFQSVGTERDDIWKLVVDINGAAAGNAVPESTISLTFNAIWPTLQGELDQVTKQASADAPERSQDEIMQELLTLARRQEQSSQLLLNQIVAVSERTIVTLESRALERRYEEEQYSVEIARLKAREHDLQKRLALWEQTPAKSVGTGPQSLAVIQANVVKLLRERGFAVPSEIWKQDDEGESRLIVNGQIRTLTSLMKELVG